jgi:hypothetical protein
MRATLMLLAACGSTEPAPLIESVGASFAECNEADLKFLAARHNVQLAFEPCGFAGFSSSLWAPDGRRMYFQLPASAHILEADRPTRDIATLAIPQPIGTPAWLGADRLVIPIGPAAAGEPTRLAIWDQPTPDPDGALPTGQLTLRPLPAGWTSVPRVEPGDADGEVIVVVGGADGAVTPHRLDLASGATQPAFPAAAGPATTWTWSRALRLAVIGHGETVRLVAVDTGEVLDTWPEAHAGDLDATGRWLILERVGAPISPYFQRTWDELSPAVREREEARAKAAAAKLPAWSQQELRPPSLDVVDLKEGRRWSFTGFLGEGAGWYDAAPGWLSFRLWGFEGKQVKANVALVDLSARLTGLAAGAPPFAVEAWAPSAPSAQAPSEP